MIQFDRTPTPNINLEQPTVINANLTINGDIILGAGAIEDKHKILTVSAVNGVNYELCGLGVCVF
jgi:phage baseplate assembly protein gpV